MWVFLLLKCFDSDVFYSVCFSSAATAGASAWRGHHRRGPSGGVEEWRVGHHLWWQLEPAGFHRRVSRAGFRYRQGGPVWRSPGTRYTDCVFSAFCVQEKSTNPFPSRSLHILRICKGFSMNRKSVHMKCEHHNHVLKKDWCKYTVDLKQSPATELRMTVFIGGTVHVHCSIYGIEGNDCGAKPHIPNIPSSNFILKAFLFTSLCHWPEYDELTDLMVKRCSLLEWDQWHCAGQWVRGSTQLVWIQISLWKDL